jgi:hypothetical protein
MSDRSFHGVSRAVIPSLDPFALTSPPSPAPLSRDDYLIAEFERRFGGRAVRVQTERSKAEIPEDSGQGMPREVPEPTCSGFRGRLKGETIADPEQFMSKELREPEWSGFRGRVGKLLWDRGLEAKALRFVNCQKYGRPGVCTNYPVEHKFFVPHGCEVVFCKECADELHRALLLDYWHVVCNAVLDFAAERAEHERLCKLQAGASGAERQKIGRELGALWERVGTCIAKRNWVLARVTFTLKSDGSEITPERVKALNQCVGTALYRSVGSRKGYGVLFVDEVGFETRGHLPDSERVAHGLNLHAHGLYFGPRLDWHRARDLWMEVTKEKFGVESRGFFITRVKHFKQNPGRAIRWALNHMFKYVSKPPAVTPERLAALIAAFDGARRVHARGLFFGKKPKRERKECPCPKCRAMGIASAISFEGDMLKHGGCNPRLVPIEDLRSRGYVLLRDAGRNAVLAMGASP